MQQVIPECAEHFDIAPAEPFAHQQLVQRIVARAPFGQSAQRSSHPIFAINQRADDLGRCLDAEPLKKNLPAPREDDRKCHLFADGQRQVLERAQRLREAHGSGRIDLQRCAVRRIGADARFELRLQHLEPLEILGHFLGPGGLAVEAAARLGPYVALEQAPAFDRPERLLERRADAVLPCGDDALGDLAHLVDVDWMLEIYFIEVEEQQRDDAKVGPRIEGDGAERLLERPSQIFFRLVGVVKVGERDGDGHVAGTLTPRDHDLVVARHVDEAADRLLERRHVRVEQLATGEMIEERAGLAIAVRVALLAALGQHRGQLLLHQRHVLRFGREGALRKAASQQRGGGNRSVRLPLANDNVVDRLEMMNRLCPWTVVDVDDAVVTGRGPQLGRLRLHQSREHDREQSWILEHAQRARLIRVRLAIGPELVAKQPEHHEVVGPEPVEERTCCLGVAARGAALTRPKARSELRYTANHGRVVLDAEEHGLQDREDLMFGPPQPFARVNALDVELAQQLA